jgi:hypothetical protein
LRWFAGQSLGWLCSHVGLKPIHHIGFQGAPPAWLANPDMVRLLNQGTKFVPGPGPHVMGSLLKRWTAFKRIAHFALYFGSRGQLSGDAAKYYVPNPGWSLPAAVKHSPPPTNTSVHV